MEHWGGQEELRERRGAAERRCVCAGVFPSCPLSEPGKGREVSDQPCPQQPGAVDSHSLNKLMGCSVNRRAARGSFCQQTVCRGEEQRGALLLLHLSHLPLKRSVEKLSRRSRMQCEHAIVWIANQTMLLVQKQPFLLQPQWNM